MPGRVCWFCDRYAHMSFVDARAGEVPGGVEVDFMGVYVCDSCRHLSLGTLRTTAGAYGRSIEDTLRTHEEHLTWIPPKALGKSFDDVPSAIAAAASEVHSALSIDARRAAIAVARAVVEATAKDKGITSGTLQEKIDSLAEQGLIRAHTREAAHEVRLDGNSIAHGDLATEPPDAAEAEEIVALMDELLAEVYQQPARVARVRESRAKRQQAASTS